jgi:hypothetical protein
MCWIAWLEHRCLREFSSIQRSLFQLVVVSDGNFSRYQVNIRRHKSVHFLGYCCLGLLVISFQVIIMIPRIHYSAYPVHMCSHPQLGYML